MATIAVGVAAGTALAAVGGYVTYRVARYLKRKKSSYANQEEDEALLSEDQEVTLETVSLSESEDDFVLVSLHAGDDSKDEVEEGVEKDKKEVAEQKRRPVEPDSDRVRPTKPLPPIPQPKVKATSTNTSSTVNSKVSSSDASSSAAPAPPPKPAATPISTSGRVKDHIQALDTANFAAGSSPAGKVKPKTPPKQPRSPPVAPKPKPEAKQDTNAATPSPATPPSWMKASPNAVHVMPLGAGQKPLVPRRTKTDPPDGNQTTEALNKENKIVKSPTPISRILNGNLETPISFDEPMRPAALKVQARIRGPQNRRPPTRR